MNWMNGGETKDASALVKDHMLVLCCLAGDVMCNTYCRDVWHSSTGSFQNGGDSTVL